MKNAQINEICNLFSFNGTYFRLDTGWLHRCFRKLSLKTQMTRDRKPPPVSHIASIKETVGPPAGRLGHCSGCLVPLCHSVSFEPVRSMAGPGSFSPASGVGTGSFSLFHLALPRPAGHGAWPRRRVPNALRASAGGRDP